MFSTTFLIQCYQFSLKHFISISFGAFNGLNSPAWNFAFLVLENQMMPDVNEIRYKIREHIEAGKAAEGENDFNTAIRHYETAIDYRYPDPVPYQRLMILYRKEKNYKEELRVITTGLDVLINDIEERKKKSLSSRNMRKVKELSTAFMKSSGLKNKNGKTIYYPEPVPGWIKRKELVEKKVKRK